MEYHDGVISSGLKSGVRVRVKDPHRASDTPLEWMYRMRSPGRMTVRA